MKVKASDRMTVVYMDGFLHRLRGLAGSDLFRGSIAKQLVHLTTVHALLLPEMVAVAMDPEHEMNRQLSNILAGGGIGEHVQIPGTYDGVSHVYRFALHPIFVEYIREQVSDMENELREMAAAAN